MSDTVVAHVVVVAPTAAGASERWTVLQVQANADDVNPIPFADRVIANDDVFQAFLISLGLLGVIAAMVVEVRPAFFLQRRRFPRRWRELRGDLTNLAMRPPEGVRGRGWRYELHLNPVAVRRFFHVPFDEPSLGATGDPEWVALELQTDEWDVDPDYVPGKNTFGELEGAFSQAGEDLDLRWFRPSMFITGAMYEDEAGLFGDRSYRVLRGALHNVVRAWGTEWFVPLEHAPAAIDWLLERNLALGYGHEDRLLNPIAIRFAHTRRGLLSPSRFGTDEIGCAIQSSVPVKTVREESIDQRDILVRWGDAFMKASEEHGWRTQFHWGFVNDAFDRAQLEARYAGLDAWREVFLTLNRNGRFDTQLAHQLGLDAWRAAQGDRPGAYEALLTGYGWPSAPRERIRHRHFPGVGDEPFDAHLGAMPPAVVSDDRRVGDAPAGRQARDSYGDERTDPHHVPAEPCARCQHEVRRYVHVTGARARDVGQKRGGVESDEPPAVPEPTSTDSERTRTRASGVAAPCPELPATRVPTTGAPKPHLRARFHGCGG